MKMGLIGLGLSGKTTIFNSVAHGKAEVSGYLTRKGEVHLGRVLVPDARVDWLAELSRSRKTTYAEVEYMDVAGFSGEKKNGAEAEIPQDLRDCDALAHVVRAFEDPGSVHPLGSVDVMRDVRLIDEELMFTDLISIETRIDKIDRQAKMGKNENLRTEYDLLEKIRLELEEGKPLREMELAPDNDKMLRGFRFLSAKPILIIINVGEEDIPRIGSITEQYATLANHANTDIEVICGKIQMELLQIPEEERQAFMDDLGLKGAALDRVIKKSYELLGLISFLTTGEDETRAWTIKSGSTAQQAAGAIHADFERGFIRAQVVPYDALRRYGSEAEARKHGLVRLEGKDYVVQDGDEILFRFNV
jgi:GTP-binding protein YchF